MTHSVQHCAKPSLLNRLRAVKANSSQNLLTHAILISTVFLSACGGGSGSSGDDDTVPFESNGNPTSDISIDSNSNPTSGTAASTSVANSELISSADSSVLRMALAGGVDLTRSVLSTNFQCYTKLTNDITTPLLTITTDGSSYSTTLLGLLGGQVGETGQWRYIETEDDEHFVEFVSAIDTTIFRLELTPYGQVLHWTEEEDQAVVDSCYQEGAAHDFALQRYQMNTPELAGYQCQVLETGASAGLLTLRADGAYDVDASSGSYRVSDVVSPNDEGTPTVSFDNGPFMGMSASYVEFPDSGYQELYFEETSSFSSIAGASSSSEAQMRCSRTRTPRPFALYGSTLAVEPEAPVVALSGLHAIDASVLTSRVNTNRVIFVDFRPNGYVYTGVPQPGGADCSLTSPGGLPYCDTYQFDGTALSIGMFGEPAEQEPIPASPGADSTLSLFDGKSIELVSTINAATLLGDWEYEDTDAGNLSLCIVGFCSGRSSKTGITFSSNGTFSSDSDSFGFSSSNFVNVSSFGQSESSSFMTGTYTLNGNFLTMQFANGQSSTQLVHFGFDNTLLAIGERGFRKQ